MGVSGVARSIVKNSRFVQGQGPKIRRGRLCPKWLQPALHEEEGDSQIRRASLGVAVLKPWVPCWGKLGVAVLLFWVLPGNS